MTPYLLAADSRYLPVKPHIAKLLYLDFPRRYNYNHSGIFIPRNDYDNYLFACLRSCLRLADYPSYILIFTDHRHRTLVDRTITEKCCEPVVKYDHEIIWHYNFGVYTRHRFVPSHETILVYKKGKPKFNWEDVAVVSQRQEANDSRADWRGRTPGDVLSISRVSGKSMERRHFIDKESRSCQPEELVTILIKAFSQKGDLVVDPFLGGGVTALVCRRLERRFIGWDICENYVNEVAFRLNDWVSKVERMK